MKMYSTSDRWNDYEQDYSAINANVAYLDHHQQINSQFTNLSSMPSHESSTILSLDENNCSEYK